MDMRKKWNKRYEAIFKGFDIFSGNYYQEHEIGFLKRPKVAIARSDSDVAISGDCHASQKSTFLFLRASSSLEGRISDLFNISTANKVVKAYEKGEILKNQKVLKKAFEFRMWL